jgi:hypothetical protein
MGYGIDRWANMTILQDNFIHREEDGDLMSTWEVEYVTRKPSNDNPKSLPPAEIVQHGLDHDGGYFGPARLQLGESSQEFYKGV